MKSRYKILSFRANDMMSDLACNNHVMFVVLSCFGIDLGFKDQSVEQVCNRHGVDTQTLLAIANVLIADNKESVDHSKVSIAALINYLRRSHAYYIECKLPSIDKSLREAISRENPLSTMVLNYYQEYIDQIKRHMIYEERVVFSYAEDLIAGRENDSFRISMLEEHHDDRTTKLTELNSVIVKYYTASNTYELCNSLYDVFACEELLTAHSSIEDYLLTPAIQRLELERGLK